MNYIVYHWSFDPFLILATIVAIWHEIGLRQLAKRSRPERARQRRIRSLWFYSGLAVLLIAVESPIDYWADSYFVVHMVQHLLLMLAAPSMILAGAPGQPLLDALPGRSGHSVIRGVSKGDWARPLRAFFHFLTKPLVAVAFFNIVMVVWHIPAMFDFGENNQLAHIWLEHGSMFASGILFWMQFIDSPPFRPQLTPVRQIAAIVASNTVMVIVAMSLSVLANHSIYSVYNNLPGVSLPPFADQQIGAAILWVCGDFWAAPILIKAGRKLIADDGNIDRALERLVRQGGRKPLPGTWTARAPR